MNVQFAASNANHRHLSIPSPRTATSIGCFGFFALEDGSKRQILHVVEVGAKDSCHVEDVERGNEETPEARLE